MQIPELQKEIIAFRDARDWKKFHNPKDLVNAIAIEVSELMEHFLRKSQEESYDIAKNKPEVKEEIADIFNYLLLLAHEADIDLSEVVLEKIKKNDAKYPVKKVKGIFKKYNEL
ncbi:MAG TPA: nucleotide pyrophosphohydrolase [Candidatus Absconditabacterales bacterium]|nr:nucleotide pyrophosphohydrolase [Candidatus Absconditabacterales bacterium]